MPTATSEQLNQLHRALTREMLGRMKTQGGRLSTEFLSVVRLFLANNGTGGPFSEPRNRLKGQLEDLYALYVAELLKAVQRPNPSASLITELRHFLREQAIHNPRPQSAPVDVSKLTLPFPK